MHKIKQYEIKTMRLPKGTMESFKLLAMHESIDTNTYMYDFLIKYLEAAAKETKNHELPKLVRRALTMSPKLTNILKQEYDN